MPDYRETTGEAVAWRRARAVEITNEIGQTPSMSFREEDVASVNGKTFATKLPGSLTGYFDPAATFPLLNPATGEALGTTMSHAELYTALHSLYIHLATLRDTPPVSAEA